MVKIEHFLVIKGKPYKTKNFPKFWRVNAKNGKNKLQIGFYFKNVSIILTFFRIKQLI